MKRFAYMWASWKEDRLLRRVVRNTGYLFSANTLSLGLSLYQGLLAAYLLGPQSYGVLGLVITFASNVNRLLSFRMGEPVIKYVNQYLAQERRDLAAGVVKLAALTEGVSSILAFLLLVLLSPLAIRWFIKDPIAQPWIPLYGLALLGNLFTETSTALLQIGGRFRAQAIITLVQNITTAAGITLAFIMKWGVFEVMLAYLAGKMVFGLAMMILGWQSAARILGPVWWRAPMQRVPEKAALGRFALSTNLSGTVNMLIRDNEVLWAGLFLSSLEAGYYKFALALMNVLMLPILPFIQTTYPEITRAVTQRMWKTLRSLLRRTSLIALGWTTAVGVGLVLVGPWFLSWFKDGAYLPAFPLILALLIGYGFANIFYWNRPLLLALGKPNDPLMITLVVGILKTLLMFVLVKRYGVLSLALLLSSYFILSVSMIIWRGIRDLSQLERDHGEVVNAHRLL
ncbi:lipopolysaccharide biosynthesis protein [Thermanaerothrix sp. 4228-RoL]|uniref:Lipopolysaccharide biosynthesis protein n=1 Tax=Thermanaerothrix solaris TaxID=3058434 RepID=A0ABU3NKJ2_9CHLR|nr:lipopolysaccharide biosynthesis protein [Thermanaerothrix sp. 4228-RoL]MDT8897364.1 lipopolysaccharide biosynthesis protein [Thermanaerothrix sp. 4228-RoL]